MEVIICPDADAVAQLAAAKVERVARDRGPQPVIGVATGSSPVALYDALADIGMEPCIITYRGRGYGING